MVALCLRPSLQPRPHRPAPSFLVLGLFKFQASRAGHGDWPPARRAAIHSKRTARVRIPARDPPRRFDPRNADRESVTTAGLGRCTEGQGSPSCRHSVWGIQPPYGWMAAAVCEAQDGA
jgi:hypothetical protein